MVDLTSFEEPVDALVVGANGGLGHALVAALLQADNVSTVHAWSRHPAKTGHDKLRSKVLDAADEPQLAEAASEIERLSLVIVAAGVLHADAAMRPEKTWRAIDPAQMAESFRINTILPALVAKHTLPLLARKGKSVFCALSARVGSISDNRLGGWYSYRASKAALNQIIKCASIELRRTHPEAVCLGLHPGTVDTGLSRPFQSTAATKSRLFSPDQSAAHLLGVIDQALPDSSGSLIAWDGTVVQP